MNPHELLKLSQTLNDTQEEIVRLALLPRRGKDRYTTLRLALEITQKDIQTILETIP